MTSSCRAWAAMKMFTCSLTLYFVIYKVSWSMFTVYKTSKCRFIIQDFLNNFPNALVWQKLLKKITFNHIATLVWIAIFHSWMKIFKKNFLYLIKFSSPGIELPYFAYLNNWEWQKCIPAFGFIGFMIRYDPTKYNNLDT